LSCKHFVETRAIGATAAVALALLMISCGRDDAAQRASREALLEGTHVRGGERLAWSQRATADELKTATFVVYVDDAPMPLQEVRCEQATGPDHDCSARLPAMTSGRHLLEIAMKSPAGAESPRSPVMIVVAEDATGQPRGQ
jgi:hypothetical protein